MATGLEPLAVLGLVCNVFQLFGHAVTSIQIARRIWVSYSADSNPGLLDSIDKLAGQLQSRLGRIASGSPAVRPLDEHEQLLFSISERCRQAARDLKTLLQQAPPRGRWLRAVLWCRKNRKKLGEFENSLNEAKGLLGLSIVGAILQTVTRDRQFLNGLDPTHKVIITRVLGGEKDIMVLVTRDGQLTRGFVRETATETQRRVRDEGDLTRAHMDAAMAGTAANVRHEGDSTRGLVSDSRVQILGRIGTEGACLGNRVAREASDTRSRIDFLERSIQSGHRDVRMGICGHIDGRDRESANKALRQQILDSLLVGEMFRRERSIDPRCRGTFTWFFAGPDPGSSPSSAPPGGGRRHPGQAFSSWALDGTGSAPVFWVTGKAGSGKSTLVHHLANHLEEWDEWKRRNKDAILVFHFFWLLGNHRQTASFRGFLCSVLYQLAEKSPAVLDLICREMHLRQIQRIPRDFMDWSVDDLQKCLSSVLKSCRHPVFICIDAVDEIAVREDNGHDLARFQEFVLGADSGGDAPLVPLSSIPTVKLFISSRPEIDLRREPDLRLHEYTGNDLERLARRDLRILREDSRSKQLDHLVRRLRVMAEGVFLWLKLVVQYLNRNGKYWGELEDVDSEIEKTLGELPCELGDLYQEMWDRVPEHRHPCQEAKSSLYLNVVLWSAHDEMRTLKPTTEDNDVGLDELTGPDLMLMVCALEDDAAGSILYHDGELCAELERSLTDKLKAVGSAVKRTAGMLELADLRQQDFADGHRPAGYFGMPNMAVRFVHRSAYDFLLGTESGTRILSKAGVPSRKVRYVVARAYLATARVFRRTTYGRFPVCRILHWLSREGHKAVRGDPDSLEQQDRAEILRLCEALYTEGTICENTLGIPLCDNAEQRDWFNGLPPDQRATVAEKSDSYRRLAGGLSVPFLVISGPCVAWGPRLDALRGREVAADVKASALLYGHLCDEHADYKSLAEWMGDCNTPGSLTLPPFHHPPSSLALWTPLTPFTGLLLLLSVVILRRPAEILDERDKLYNCLCFLDHMIDAGGADLLAPVHLLIGADLVFNELSVLWAYGGGSGRFVGCCLMYEVPACVMLREALNTCALAFAAKIPGRRPPGPPPRHEVEGGELVAGIEGKLLGSIAQCRPGNGRIIRILGTHPKFMAIAGRWAEWAVSDSDSAILAETLLDVIRGGREDHRGVFSRIKSICQSNSPDLWAATRFDDKGRNLWEPVAGPVAWEHCWDRRWEMFFDRIPCSVPKDDGLRGDCSGCENNLDGEYDVLALIDGEMILGS